MYFLSTPFFHIINLLTPMYCNMHCFAFLLISIFPNICNLYISINIILFVKRNKDCNKGRLQNEPVLFETENQTKDINWIKLFI